MKTSNRFYSLLRSPHCPIPAGLITAILFGMVGSACAADVTLLTTNGLGASSFNAALSWSNGLAPAAGNSYIVPSGFSLRTPADATTNFTFAGDSLIFNASTFIYKGGTNINTITVPLMTLNGATINNASNSSTAFIIASNNITIAGTATSTIFSNNASITIAGPITGNSGTLLLNTNITGRQVILSGVNTYIGKIQVTGAAGAVLSETGRLAFAMTGGVFNTVSGTAATVPMTFNGGFTIDTTGASTVIGTSYTLVDVATLTEAWGSGFVVDGWHKAGNIWISPDGNYTFSTVTGALVRIDTDSDFDGLPDSWEIAHFGSLAQSGADDPDLDFCTNLEEYAANTDPNSKTSFPDTDGDGLADGWETHYFGNLAQLPGVDADGDGSTNLQEFLAGTDPTLKTSFPDTDGDQISDDWEVRYFGSTAACIPSQDTDGDSYTNLEEYLADTNPKSQVSSPDSDGDGLPDGWEIKYFGLAGEARVDAIAHVNGTADSDGDGRTDLVEYHEGTNPLVADTAPATLAYWRFEENKTGLVAYPQVAAAVKDVTGNGNDMITYADYTAPTYSTRHLDATVANTGATNYSSLGFTVVAGNRYTSDNIYTPGTAPINTTVFTDYTVEAAFRTTLAGTAQGIIGKGGNPTNTAAPYQAPFTLKLNAAGKLVAGMVDSVPAAHEVVGTRTVAVGAWYSAAVTISSTTLSLWMKAPGDAGYVLEGSTAINGAFPTTVANAAWVIGQTEYNAAGNFVGFDSFNGDLDEIRISSGVLANSSFLASPNSAGDSDGDGLPDAWEISHFGGLGQTATGDYDGDGTDNLTEYRLGLDPANGASRFAATLSLADGSLTWPSVTGVIFTVQRSTTMEAGSWENIGTVPGTAGTASFVDTSPLASPKVFYRVILSP